MKYRPSWKVEVICKILTEVWPFFDLDIDIWLNCGFRLIAFEAMQQFHSNFTEG